MREKEKIVGARVAIAEQARAKVLPRLRRSLKKLARRFCEARQEALGAFDEKAVHDTRVSARRMLATIDLLRPFLDESCVRKMNRFLKKRLNSLNDLRDLQVQFASVNNLQNTYPASRLLCRWLERRQKRAARRARKKLKAAPVKGFLRDLAEARRQLKRPSSSLRRASDASLLLRNLGLAFFATRASVALIDPRRPETIHHTRIHFKRFRYMIELLRKDLPPIDDRYLEELHHFQTMMGDIQDAEVLLKTLERFFKQEDIEPQLGRALREECLRRREWLIRVFLDAANQLNDFWPLTSRRKKYPARRRNLKKLSA